MNNKIYYDKYLKYKNKYQQLKLQMNIIKYGGSQKNIFKATDVSSNFFIRLDSFEIDCIDNDLYCKINKLISKSDINFDPKKLFFVKNTDGNEIIGVVGFDDNRGFKKFTSSEMNLIQAKINSLTTEYLSKTAINKNLMDTLLKSIDDINNPEIIINYIIENFKTPDEAYNFLVSFVNNNDPPANKTIMYYAVRKGNINLLHFILDYVGEDNFIKLMELKDAEGRTLFMISTHALANQNQIFDLVSNYTPDDFIYCHDINGRTALDWYHLREINNPYILKKLQKN